MGWQDWPSCRKTGGEEINEQADKRKEREPAELVRTVGAADPPRVCPHVSGRLPADPSGATSRLQAARSRCFALIVAIGLQRKYENWVTAPHLANTLTLCASRLSQISSERLTFKRGRSPQDVHCLRDGHHQPVQGHNPIALQLMQLGQSCKHWKRTAQRGIVQWSALPCPWTSRFHSSLFLLILCSFLFAASCNNNEQQNNKHLAKDVKGFVRDLSALCDITNVIMLVFWVVFFFLSEHWIKQEKVKNRHDHF